MAGISRRFPKNFDRKKGKREEKDGKTGRERHKKRPVKQGRKREDAKEFPPWQHIMKKFICKLTGNILFTDTSIWWKHEKTVLHF